MQPYGGVFLRVLRGEDRCRHLLRGQRALPLPCLRGKNLCDSLEPGAHGIHDRTILLHSIKLVQKMSLVVVTNVNVKQGT